MGGRGGEGGTGGRGGGAQHKAGRAEDATAPSLDLHAKLTAGDVVVLDIPMFASHEMRPYLMACAANVLIAS